jgi:hypothetical protein
MPSSQENGKTMGSSTEVSEDEKSIGGSKSGEKDGKILDSYTKIWKTIPEKTDINRLSKSPLILHSGAPA